MILASFLICKHFVVFLYHLQTVQKMEQKRFGVRVSLIEQLKAFQFLLRQWKKMEPIRVYSDVACPFTGFTEKKEIIASRRTISIVPFNPPIEGFLLPLQVMQNIDEWSVKIKLNDFFRLIFSFDTPAEKIKFTNALGDLNIESSDESNSDDDNNPPPPDENNPPPPNDNNHNPLNGFI